MLDEVDKRFFLMVTPQQDIGNVGLSDISRSCDICGEGKSYGRKFRLHLYTKETYDNAAIACFNCGYTNNLYGYLKDNHPQEFTLYRNEKKSSGFNELKLIALEKNENIERFEEQINDDPEIENFMNMPTSDSTKYKIEPTQENVKEIIQENLSLPILVEPVKGFAKLPLDAIEYIKNRGIEPQQDWLYSPKGNKVIFNGMEQTLNEYIIVPLKIGLLWYGFQAIAWKQKKFFVYLVTGNQSWKVENWDNINKDEPVYIFESVYDRLSSGISNSIAQLGANLSIERLKELKQPVFCLDNTIVDDKAKEETEKYLKLGYECLIWPKGSEKFKDTNDLRKINVPYEKIKTMITSNIYKGMQGVLKVKML